jgi:hypothetical protein
MKEVKLSGELTQLNEYLFARKINERIEIFEAVALDGNTVGYSLGDRVISSSGTASYKWWV